jgi:hypothetical protein
MKACKRAHPYKSRLEMARELLESARDAQRLFKTSSAPLSPSLNNKSKRIASQRTSQPNNKREKKTDQRNNNDHRLLVGGFLQALQRSSRPPSPTAAPAAHAAALPYLAQRLTAQATDALLVAVGAHLSSHSTTSSHHHHDDRPPKAVRSAAEQAARSVRAGATVQWAAALQRIAAAKVLGSRPAAVLLVACQAQPPLAPLLVDAEREGLRLAWQRLTEDGVHGSLPRAALQDLLRDLLQQTDASSGLQLQLRVSALLSVLQAAADSKTAVETAAAAPLSEVVAAIQATIDALPVGAPLPHGVAALLAALCETAPASVAEVALAPAAVAPHFAAALPPSPTAAELHAASPFLHPALGHWGWPAFLPALEATGALKSAVGGSEAWRPALALAALALPQEAGEPPLSPDVGVAAGVLLVAAPAVLLLHGTDATLWPLPQKLARAAAADGLAVLVQDPAVLAGRAASAGAVRHFRDALRVAPQSTRSAMDADLRRARRLEGDDETGAVGAGDSLDRLPAAAVAWYVLQRCKGDKKRSILSSLPHSPPPRLLVQFKTQLCPTFSIT